MLLSYLNKKEKLKFLDLVMHMVNVEEETAPVEKRLIDIFIAEIGVDIAEEYSFEHGDDASATRKFFEDSNEIVKKICLYNLMKVTLVDDLYNTHEHEFVEDTRKAFNIDDKTRKSIIELIYEESDLREKVKRTITRS